MNFDRQTSLGRKKNTKLSPASNVNSRLSNYKPRIKTQHSPPKSLSKQQIKNTIKKIVYNNQSNGGSMVKNPKINIGMRQQSRRSRKARSRLQIAIPYIENSLTPKSNHQTNKIYQRQVQSTKAADNKMFTSSGRYDLKQLFKAPKQELQNETADKQSSSFKGKQIEAKIKKSKQENFKFIKQQHKNREEQFDPKNCLTSEEYQKFGDRFPQKFKRVALLGRGGFSVVWLGVHRSTKRKFAIKQILTKNPHQTHLKQIWFGSYFFQKGGQPRQQFQNHIGINNICRLYSYEIKSLDSWLYYQILQDSLGSSLFELKSQTHNNQKYYKIHYKQYIYRMRSNINELKCLIIEISKALHLINSHNIVHSDLKTQNILLKTHKSNPIPDLPYIKQLKLIDFGSSFLFTNLKQFSMATPEYMPPEILNYILFQNKLEYDVIMLNKMQKYKNAWVVDIWSLGCIILEIISGVPLWMSLPCKIETTNRTVTGLFAVKGRLFNKIINKQIQVVKNLNQHLIKDNNSGIKIDKEISDILSKMLNLNPDQRISPLQVLNYFGVECKPQKIPSY